MKQALTYSSDTIKKAYNKAFLQSKENTDSFFREIDSHFGITSIVIIPQRLFQLSVPIELADTTDFSLIIKSIITTYNIEFFTYIKTDHEIIYRIRISKKEVH